VVNVGLFCSRDSCRYVYMFIYRARLSICLYMGLFFGTLHTARYNTQWEGLLPYLYRSFPAKGKATNDRGSEDP